MADDEVAKKREERAKKFVKAVNPKKPKNGDGTTFSENLRGKYHTKYKGQHRKED